MANACWTWRVEGTVPTESNGRPWNKNISIQVITTSLQMAVDATTEKYPNITLHKVWRDRNMNDVIVVRQTEGNDTDGK